MQKFLWFRKQFAVLVELLPHSRREEIQAFYDLVLFSSHHLLSLASNYVLALRAPCGAINIDLSGGEDGQIGPWWPCDPMEQKGWEALSRRCQDSQVGQIWPKVIITVFSGTSLWRSSTGSTSTGLIRALLMHVRWKSLAPESNLKVMLHLTFHQVLVCVYVCQH